MLARLCHIKLKGGLGSVKKDLVVRLIRKQLAYSLELPLKHAGNKLANKRFLVFKGVAIELAAGE